MGDQIGRNQPWYLYRALDADGALLYAGSTNCLERRWQEHHGTTWWPLVDHMDVDEFPSRWRAALAERVAGEGRYGTLRGGIGRGLASSMTTAELVEAMQHPAYARESAKWLACRWGLPVALIRQLRSVTQDFGAPSNVRNGLDMSYVRT